MTLERESVPMVSRLSPAHSEFPDDLVVAESPPLRRRSVESEFSERPLFVDKPSLFRRGSRAFIRFLFAVGIGVAGTLAWQAYGENAKQTVANWAAQQGWPLPWLSDRAADEPGPPAPSATQTAARSAAEPAAPAVSSLEQKVEAITNSLAAVQQRVEQLAAGQEQMAGDIAKLHAAEQEIRHQIAAIPPRPAAAPAAKPTPATVPPARPSTLPR
jgi:hypothetical protein